MLRRVSTHYTVVSRCTQTLTRCVWWSPAVIMVIFLTLPVTDMFYFLAVYIFFFLNLKIHTCHVPGSRCGGGTLPQASSADNQTNAAVRPAVTTGWSTAPVWNWVFSRNISRSPVFVSTYYNNITILTSRRPNRWKTVFSTRLGRRLRPWLLSLLFIDRSIGSGHASSP